MKKRFLSLALTLAMTISLFAGLSTAASAAGSDSLPNGDTITCYDSDFGPLTIVGAGTLDSSFDFSSFLGYDQLYTTSPCNMYTVEVPAGTYYIDVNAVGSDGYYPVLVDADTGYQGINNSNLSGINLIDNYYSQDTGEPISIKYIFVYNSSYEFVYAIQLETTTPSAGPWTVHIPTAIDSNGLPTAWGTEVTVPDGAAVDLSSYAYTIPARTGYNTGVWYYNNAPFVSGSTPVTAETWLTIHYTPISYTVTYDYAGLGSASGTWGAITSYNVEGHTLGGGNAIVGNPTVTDPDDYAFTGWTVTYLDAEGTPEAANGRPATLDNISAHTLGSNGMYGSVKLTANYTNQTYIVALPRADEQYDNYAGYLGNSRDGYAVLPMAGSAYSSSQMTPDQVTNAGKTYHSDYNYYRVPAGSAFAFNVYLSRGYSDEFKTYPPNDPNIVYPDPDHPLWNAFYDVDANGVPLEEGNGALGAYFPIANYANPDSNIARMNMLSAESPDGVIYLHIANVTPNVLTVNTYSVPSDAAVHFVSGMVSDAATCWGNTVGFTVSAPAGKIPKVQVGYDHYVNQSGNLDNAAYYYYSYGEQKYGWAKDDTTLYPDANGVYTWADIMPVINSDGPVFIKVTWYDSLDVVKDELVSRLRAKSCLFDGLPYACYSLGDFKQQATDVYNRTEAAIRAVQIGGACADYNAAAAEMQSILAGGASQIDSIRMAGLAAYYAEQDIRYTAQFEAEKLNTGYNLIRIDDGSITSQIDAAQNDNQAVVICVTGIDEGQQTAKVSANISKAALQALANAGVDLKLNTPVGDITLSNAALNSILNSDKLTDYNSIYLNLTLGSTDNLTDSQKATIDYNDSCFVYDLSVTNSRGWPLAFGNNTVTVVVPYALQPGENPNNISVWYVDVSGNVEKLENGRYHDGHVTFTTTHFSVYMIGSEIIQTVTRTGNTSYSQSLAQKTSATVTEQEKNALFSDVLAGYWAYDPIAYVTAKGYMSGTGSAFAPDGTMTCGDFAGILARMSGHTTDAVAWAKRAGIIGDSFNSAAALTRRDLAVMIVNYVTYKGGALGPENSITPSDLSSLDLPARQAVVTVVQAGVVDAASNGLFRPSGAATRAVVAKALAAVDRGLAG